MRKPEFLRLFSCWRFNNRRIAKTSEVTNQVIEVETPFSKEAPVIEVDEASFVPEKDFYQPSTESTWEAYQALITLVEAQSRTNLPHMVLCGVAEEVLSVLKSNNITAPIHKKVEIEKILNPIPDFVFNQLVSISKLITDYYDEEVPFAFEKDFYQPKSEETRTAYKLLLEMVNDESRVVLTQIQQCIVAHKVLVVLKDEMMVKKKKREMVEIELNKFITDESFDMFLFIGDLIKDFGDGSDYLDQQNSIWRSGVGSLEEVVDVYFSDNDEPVNRTAT